MGPKDAMQDQDAGVSRLRLLKGGAQRRWEIACGKLGYTGWAGVWREKYVPVRRVKSESTIPRLNFGVCLESETYAERGGPKSGEGRQHRGNGP